MSERPKFPVGVNALVVREGKLLLGKRKGDYYPGTWGLPGGHLEEGERMADGVARELLEETGMTAESFEFAGLVNDRKLHDDPQIRKHYLQISFKALNVKGEPQLLEPEHCDEWRWFHLGDSTVQIFPPHAQLVALFAKGGHFVDN